MNRLLAIVALAALAPVATALAQDPAPAAPAAQAPAPAQTMEYAVMRTNKGDLVLELDRAKAPVTVENFVRYAKKGFYDGTVFHRIVPGFVIQGGGFEPSGVQKKTDAPIDNEWQNGLKNLRGTLSMARTADPKSATSQFFVNLKDNDSLDRPISGGAGYAVFAKVVAGMGTVDAIAREPRGVRNGMQDWPVKDVVIEKVVLVSKEDADKAIAAMEKRAEPAAPEAPKAPAAPKTPKAPVAAPGASDAPAKPKGGDAPTGEPKA
jgi:cyclophilin family peptidyl-prolyl cis-trans isomerase